MWVIDDGTTRLELTGSTRGVGLVSIPEVGTPDIESDDSPIPRGDGMYMGEDFYGAQTVSLELDLRPDGDKSVRDVLAETRRFWRDPKHRSTGGHVVELRSPEGLSTFGRPRRFSPNREDELSSVIFVTADFECVTDLWFGPYERAEIGLVPPLGRGLVAPLVEPLTIQGAAVTAAPLQVGGEEPTYPVITFYGPIQNPSLWTAGWELKLRATLAYDESVTVDARPWAQSVTRNGRNAGGILMASSAWLEDLTLPPGGHTAQLRGSDPTGTARAVLDWRTAHPTF